jgi:hypothetical protein
MIKKAKNQAVNGNKEHCGNKQRENRILCKMNRIKV